MPKLNVKMLSSTLLAALGGGIAGAFSAAMNPAVYSFPKDFGSGKLWKFFFMGAGLTISGMVLHSPLGQKIMAQVQQSHDAVEQAKTQLKPKDDPPK
jgi:hypothetical protein